MSSADGQSRSEGDPREVARRLRPHSFEERYGTLRQLDPHFAEVWMRHLGGLFARPGLDFRTRLLVLVGQYTMLRHEASLAETIEAAVSEDVDLKEVLEVILQCYVYGGDSCVSGAVEVFARVTKEAGRFEEVCARGLPEDATTAGRSLEEERVTWAPEDQDDPRLPGLLERYAWPSLSAALRLRPREQIEKISSFFEPLDPGFVGLWLNAIYGGMYSRGVLDDKTRLLCMVGDCTALGEADQSRRHMRGALRNGAEPREILEVVLQSCAIVGHPPVLSLALNGLVKVLDSEDRLRELVDEDRLDAFRATMGARHAALQGSDASPQPSR